MIRMLSKIWTPYARRRRRALDRIRRRFADCGYLLDDLTNSQLEEAITGGKGGIEKAPPLTPKIIYWTLRRLSPDGRNLRTRKIKGGQTPGANSS